VNYICASNLSKNRFVSHISEHILYPIKKGFDLIQSPFKNLIDWSHSCHKKAGLQPQSLFILLYAIFVVR
jgi:hypothetical protein